MWPAFREEWRAVLFSSFGSEVHSTDSSTIAYQGENHGPPLAFCVETTQAQKITEGWARCGMLMCAALNAGHKPTTILGYLFYFNEKRKTSCL